MKKTILKSALMVMFGFGLMVGSASATTVNTTGTNNESTLNQIFTANSWNIDANEDQLTYDSYWEIAENHTGAWASMIIEIAGYAGVNTFGIYDSSHNVTLMNGSANSGDKVTLSRSGTGLHVVYSDYENGICISDTSSDVADFSSVFGFYIGKTNTPIFYSDATKNSDSADHMVSYKGTGTNGLSVGHYILAFEDKASPRWDYDYNDMVLMVESVTPLTPVPEPATMLLFGTGMAGLAGIVRRRIK